MRIERSCLAADVCPDGAAAVGETGFALSARSVPAFKGPRLAPARDFCLFLDVDGTLLDIADTPQAVVVPPNLLDSLMRAERRLDGAVALVSGRRIEDIDRLFEPLRLRAAGVHGAQFRFDPTQATQAAATVEALPNALASTVKDAVSRFPGIIVEDKGFSLAVHYRLNPKAARWLRETLQELLQATAAPSVRVEEAHYAFELKPPDFDKGKAIALFLSQEPFRGRRPIFIGDDTTDEAGFARVTARGGLAFSVGRPRPGVTGVFETPQAVRGWLDALAFGARE